MTNDALNVVVVEGGPRAMKKYVASYHRVPPNCQSGEYPPKLQQPCIRRVSAELATEWCTFDVDVHSEIYRYKRLMLHRIKWSDKIVSAPSYLWCFGMLWLVPAVCSDGGV
jgi:hypothetical protein